MSKCLAKFGMDCGAGGISCSTCDPTMEDVQNWPIEQQPEVAVLSSGDSNTVIVRGCGRLVVWRHRKPGLKWVFGRLTGQVFQHGFETLEAATAVCITWMKVKATETALKERRSDIPTR